MCVLIRVVSRYHFTFTTEYIHIVLKTFLPLVTGCCRFDQITRGKITKNWKIHHSLFDGGHFDFNTTSSPGSSPFPVAAISKSERTLGVRLRSADVALQLCPPLQFGPLTYQPIECVFVSSNQSALWSCLLHVTSQLGEGCSMSFVRFSVLIVWKTCGKFWSVFPDGFLENFTEVWSLFETFLGQRICSYVGELESVGQGWKHNQRVRRRTVATRMCGGSEVVPHSHRIFELLR